MLPFRFWICVILTTVTDPIAAVVAQTAAKPEGIKEGIYLESPYVVTPPDIPAQYAVGARKWQGIPSIERAPGGRIWAT